VTFGRRVSKRSYLSGIAAERNSIWRLGWSDRSKIHSAQKCHHVTGTLR